MTGKPEPQVKRAPPLYKFRKAKKVVKKIYKYKKKRKN